MLRPAHLLRYDRLATWITARPVKLTLVIAIVWILAGLIGHDPWKPDEAHTFGVVYRMLKTGDWIVPSLAGEPYLSKPPLVYFTAAVFGLAFSPPLPLHDAARLATGMWMALVFFFTWLTARELYGGARSWIAVLMLLGCGGLLVRGHQLISEVALLAGLAMGLYGLGLAPRRPPLGGFWLGMGVGIATLSSGLFEPIMLLLATAGMVAVSPLYRTAALGRAALIALLVAVPWAVIWPLALWMHSSALFSEWFWVDNWGRIRGLIDFHKTGYLYYAGVLPWFAWPAWPFALWSLWVEGRDGLRRREVQLPIVAFIAFFAFLSLSGEGRDVLGLPLLLPVTLLASIAFARLPRGALNAYYWFGIMIALVFAAVGWFYFGAIEWEAPRRLADHMHDMQPGYVRGVHPLRLSAALLATAIWLVLIFNVKRTPERPVILWAAGLTTVWVLAALLLGPWIDTGKTYRSMVTELRHALPAQHGCIYSQGLGEPQRAMLDYFGNIATLRLELPGKKPGCRWLITQDNWSNISAMGAPWELVWEGRRPGDNVERFRLYRRPEPQH